MLDFNTISIKDCDDLKRALLVKMDSKHFSLQVKGMIERWGIDSTLSMLGNALFEGPEPLIVPTHHIVDNFDKSGDPMDYFLEKIK